jgi:hypothetical protein
MFLNFLENQEEGPPGAALLAVRAARRGIAANPDDARAYLRLFQAYSTLRKRTPERVWAPRFPLLNLLRNVQMVGALQNAVELQPDIAPAHLELGKIFQESGYLDLAFDHRTEYVNLVRAAGPEPGEQLDDFKDRLEKLEKPNKDLEDEVQKNEQLYLVRSTNQGKVQKAQLALQLGLAKKALEVLLESEYVDLGTQGAQIQLELLLRTGNLRKLRPFMKDFEALRASPDRPLNENLGLTAVGVEILPASEWYALLYAAAIGDYRDADNQLEEMIKQLDPTMPVAKLVADEFLQMISGMPVAGGAHHRLRQEIVRQQQLGEVFRGIHEQLNLQALRGLIALETEDSASARKHFDKALQASSPPDRYLPMLAALGSTSPLATVAGFPVEGEAAIGPRLDFLARPMALRYEELFQAANP